MLEQNEPQYSLKLTKPIVARIHHPLDDSRYFDIDIYAASRFLDQAAKQPTQDAEFETIAIWIGSNLKLTKEQSKEEINETNARVVKEFIQSAVAEWDATLKKKLESMLSLPSSTKEDSQPDGKTGANESSELGHQSPQLD